MSLTATKCTQCGANIEIDETKQKNKCQYCGANYVKEEKNKSINRIVEVNSLDWINVGEFVSAVNLLKNQRAEERYFETAAIKETERALIEEARVFEGFDIKTRATNDERVRHLETWVRQIRRKEDYETIPFDIRYAYETNSGRSGFDSGIYMLYCPSYERAGVKLSQKLLYVLNSCIICIEKEFKKITLKKFKAEDIEVMEIGSILLDGWITIAGKNEEKREIFTVYYNEANCSLFEKLIEILRMTSLGLEYPPKYDKTVSHSIQDKSFSFMNYTRNIILENEGPVQYVFQPSIINNRFKTVLANDHMLLLSKSEVVQITKGKLKRNGQAIVYGHTITFYSRCHINKPEYFINEKSGRLHLKLSAGAYSSNALFDKENIPDVAALISRF